MCYNVEYKRYDLKIGSFNIQDVTRLTKCNICAVILCLRMVCVCVCVHVCVCYLHFFGPYKLYL